MEQPCMPDDDQEHIDGTKATSERMLQGLLDDVNKLEVTMKGDLLLLI